MSKSGLYLGCLFSLALFAPSHALAATYYVSPTGSDTSAGSSSAPFKTFSKSMTALKAGDTLEVKGGTYSERLEVTVSGTASQPVTVKASAGESVILDAGGNKDTPLLVGASRSHIKIDGFEVKSSSYECVLISGSNITLSNLNVHDCVKFGYRLKGTNITVENSSCHDSVTENVGGTNTSGGWGACLRTAPGSANITVRDTHIYNNWGEGLIIGQAAGFKAYNNTVHDNYSQNIYIGNAFDVDVYSNMTYSTNSKYFRSGKPANCISASEENINATWGAQLHNIRVFNNIAYSCKIGVGYTYTELSGNGCDNCVYANNTLVNTDGIKFIAGSKNHVLVVNNIVNGGSITLPSGDVVSRNNLTTNPGFATTPTFDTNSFKLAANSGAIGKAEVVSGISTDFTGASRDGNPDIGAFEYNAGSSTPAPSPSPTPTPSPIPSPTPTPSPSPSPSPSAPACTSPTFSQEQTSVGWDVIVANAYDMWATGNPNFTQSNYDSTSQTIRLQFNVPTGTVDIWNSNPSKSGAIRCGSYKFGLKPGDANGDSKVDGLDYVAWLSHYNQSYTGASNGDFNNSGKVDGLDYVVWLNNYGK